MATSLVASRAVANATVPLEVLAEDLSTITVKLYLDDFETLCRDASRAGGLDIFFQKRRNARDYIAAATEAAHRLTSEDPMTDDEVEGEFKILLAALTDARRALEG